MTKIKFTQSLMIHYKPRNTDYRILHHNVKIKRNISLFELALAKLHIIPTPPSWELGCVYLADSQLNKYLAQEDVQVYTRPYSMFDMTKWEIKN